MSSPTPIRRGFAQSSDLKPTVSHFLLQIQTAHVRTRGHEPIPLHFDSKVDKLVPYPWPVDPATEARLPPSEFEAYRLTHNLRAPCCLCAFVEGKEYTEARIGVAETVTEDLTRNQSVLNGEIVAACAKQECGYFLCLERFYSLRGLKLGKCLKRSVPLPLREIAGPIAVDESFRVGDGLFQVMTDAVIRGKRSRAFEVVKPQKGVKPAVVRDLGKGIPEERFWSTFVQCFVCKAVAFRETYGANHVCAIEQPKRVRYSPCKTLARGPSVTRSRVAAARLQRTYAFIAPSSPVPTESPGLDDGVGLGRQSPSVSRDSDSSDSEDELPVLSSDFDLPTLSEIFAGIA